MEGNKQRGKGIFVKVLSLVTTVALFFAFAVVPSYASVTATDITSYSGTYSSGIPMSFEWVNDARTRMGLVTSANVYKQSYANGSYTTTSTTYGGFTPVFSYSDAPSSNSAADVYMNEVGWDCISGYTDRTFAYYQDLDLTGLTTNVLYHVTQGGLDLVPDPVPVTYTYDVSFVDGTGDDATFMPFSVAYRTTISFTGNGSPYVLFIPMLRADHLNDVLSSADLLGYEADVMLVRRISYRIDSEYLLNAPISDTFGETVYIDDGIREDRFLNDIENELTSSLERLIGEVNVTVDVAAISWTSWLKNAVAGFLDFELMPGLSLAGILGILLGIPMLLWFLKLFAGG